MTISKDLFLAILAMDSYNQGYGKGLDHGKTQIGSASVAKEDVSAEAKAAGFYAVAYDTEYGTVISYRGTDAGGPFGEEYWNNWGELIFTDYPLTRFDDFDETSVHLASKFYNAVKAATTGPINTTGHSLGGALACFVGAMNL